MLGIDLDQHATRNQLGDGDFLLHTAADVARSILVLFTDGVAETVNESGEDFGIQRAIELARASVMLRRRISRWRCFRRYANSLTTDRKLTT